METKQKERIRRLMELLKKTDRIHLKDAARMLEVSVMTIRRDLHQEDEPLPLTLLAAGMVNENDLIFFDNGQEIPLVISMIPDAITFTGICYSHRVFVALNEKPNVTAILCGGTYRARSDAFYDASNSSPLDSLNPRKIFISASGVHNHFGVSWFNPEDLATKRKAMNRGLRKILLARHALFDEVASASLAPISAFDVLISDRPLPADYVTHCQNGSVKIITPDSEDE